MFNEKPATLAAKFAHDVILALAKMDAKTRNRLLRGLSDSSHAHNSDGAIELTVSLAESTAGRGIAGTVERSLQKGYRHYHLESPDTLSASKITKPVMLRMAEASVAVGRLATFFERGFIEMGRFLIDDKLVGGIHERLTTFPSYAHRQVDYYFKINDKGVLRIYAFIVGHEYLPPVDLEIPSAVCEPLCALMALTPELVAKDKSMVAENRMLELRMGHGKETLGIDYTPLPR